MEDSNKPTAAHSSDSDKVTKKIVKTDFSKGNIAEDSASPLVIPKTTDEILNELLNEITSIDFQALAISGIFSDIPDETKINVTSEKSEESVKFEQTLKSSIINITKTHYIIICIEELIKVAKLNNWGLCKKNGSIYLYNGAYWVEVDSERFQFFLGEVALKMGVEKFTGKIHTFKSDLYKQFIADAVLTLPIEEKDQVLINLQNGTFDITPTKRVLREFDQKDFLTHQLPFAYDTLAKAPLFKKFLDEVLPDKDKQKVLAEYIGYIFIKPSYLKLEKVLLLFGTGANGKSVFFEIISALLGSNNMSNFSLQSLTNDNGYFRAKLSGKLLNYVSELNANFETSIFKQLASGEPIEARLPYKEPIILSNYAKLMFNCNELPREIEHTHAFFRRFLIIKFDVTIPEDKQDKQLSNKIIEAELSGVFNWILEGLDRLLKQRNFSKCAAIEEARIEYEKQSDTVHLFISENGYEVSSSKYILISELYKLYQSFCTEEGFKSIGKSKFIKRLNHLNLFVKRMNVGNVVYLSSSISIT